MKSLPALLLICSTATAVELSVAEHELGRLINEYRAEHDLPEIPVTVSLTDVAQQHVSDLVENEPHLEPGCNLHSWSDNSTVWSGVCYTPDHAQARGMWEKPNEITGGIYTGNDYEISASGYSTPSRALSGWQSSPGHNAVIINEGGWSRPWAAMGVGIRDRQYAVWFGHQVDPQGEVSVTLSCETSTLLGDVDGSGDVDFPDFLLITVNFGKDGEFRDGDVTCDGMIDFEDFLVLSDNFGHRARSQSQDFSDNGHGMESVPEPTGVLPFVATILVTFRFTRTAGNCEIALYRKRADASS